MINYSLIITHSEGCGVGGSRTHPSIHFNLKAFINRWLFSPPKNPPTLFH